MTEEARAQFAAYVAAIVREVPEIRDVIVGNEPNLNRFWMPQFDAAGEDVAAPAYFELLAAAYDAAKAADGDVTIWGGALAPRGIDRPGTGRDTHSPTTFIRDLGAAYRASGREEPPLDGFAFHPYPAELEHAARRADRPEVEVDPAWPTTRRSCARCWTRRSVPACPCSTASSASRRVIPAAKASLYEGDEPASPVDEATQADFYRRAIDLAACQESVDGLLLFHIHDEPALPGFQSGLYYVDGSSKTSLAPVRRRRQDRSVLALRAGRRPSCRRHSRQARSPRPTRRPLRRRAQ